MTIPDKYIGNRVFFGVRPEDLESTLSEDYMIEGKLANVEALGDLSLLYLQVGNSDQLIVVKSPGMANYKKDDVFRLQSKQEKRYLFDELGVNFKFNNANN